MPSIEQTLSLARSQLGVTESPPNSNRVILRDGTNLWVWYDGKDHYGWAWCAAFMSWVLITSGVDTPKFSYCPTWRQWFKQRGRLYNSPQIGDLAFYDWESDSIVDHVGIVVRTTLTHVIVIEGNTLLPGVPGNQSDGGGVFERVRPISSTAGFGRSVYDSVMHPAEIPKPKPPKKRKRPMFIGEIPGIPAFYACDWVNRRWLQTPHEVDVFKLDLAQNGFSTNVYRDPEVANMILVGPEPPPS